MEPKLCECGCGQPTLRVKLTDTRRGVRKGDYSRYLPGHSKSHARLASSPVLNETKLCDCGCGEPTPRATQTDRKRGKVKGQPQRFIQGHYRQYPLYVVEDRGYVTPCWIWQRAPTAKNRYGQVKSGKLAHRWMYERLIGPVPDDRELHHHCRVTRCVNPDHLQPLTVKEHHALGRAWSPRPARRLLTPAQVREIRVSTEANAQLARRLGVRVVVIAKVRQGITYREIE